jgi:hypothetical protein
MRAYRVSLSPPLCGFFFAPFIENGDAQSKKTSFY